MSRDWEVKIRWNVNFFYIINSKRSTFLDKFYRYFFYMGKSYSLPVYIFLFWLFGVGRDGIFHLLVSLLITGVVMPSLKSIFRHKRPSSLLENVHVLEPVHLKSFPSADSGYVATIFGVSLFYAHPTLSLILFLLMLAVGYGRVYMGAHFPLDVLVGYLLGFACAIGGFYVMGLI